MEKANESGRRKYTTITIPSRLFDNIKQQIKGTGFSSVSDYATYILRETVAELSNRKSNKKETSTVIEKLKALGYV